MNVLCVRRVDGDLGKEFRKGEMEEGTFSLEERQNPHTSSAGTTAGIAECWDIHYGSLASCNFL